MESKTVAALAATLMTAGLMTTDSASAETLDLAWQEPGFVLEEVIVTARYPAEEVVLEWQQPGYVMEEIVATAPRAAVTRAPQETQRIRPAHAAADAAHPLHIRIAMHLRALKDHSIMLVRGADEPGPHFESLSVSP